MARDTHGIYRVGGTRVTLDTVVRAFNRGATAEEIVQDFPSLQLPDVYQVISYYLKHIEELTHYFGQRDRDEKEFLSIHPEWSPRGLRAGPPEKPVKWLEDENFLRGDVETSRPTQEAASIAEVGVGAFHKWPFVHHSAGPSLPARFR